MTAEIVIMNREAIAVAADSAVSLMGGETERPQKIFTSANKIFGLSPCHAICIMIFNYASFMGISWETIIDCYRKQIGDHTFPTTAEYARHFLEFLGTRDDIIPPGGEENYFITNAYGLYLSVLGLIKQNADELMQKYGRVTEDDMVHISSYIVQQIYDQLNAAPMMPPMAAQEFTGLRVRFDKKYLQAIKEVFNEIPVTASTIMQLRELPPLFFVKSAGPLDPLWTNFSGVVITGFGERETFPSLIALGIQGRFNRKLRYTEKANHQIDFDTGAFIVPFAQHEMVDLFLSGLDPSFEEALQKSLSGLFDSNLESMINRIGELADEKKKDFMSAYSTKRDEIIQKIADQLKNFRNSNFNPIVNVVAALPKTDLAAMAESMVNLTSLKRRISMQEETVGGPVDVAVISKNDGLVWIKKKQYFSEDLNPHHNRRKGHEEPAGSRYNKRTSTPSSEIPTLV